MKAGDCKVSAGRKAHLINFAWTRKNISQQKKKLSIYAFLMHINFTDNLPLFSFICWNIWNTYFKGGFKKKIISGFLNIYNSWWKMVYVIVGRLTQAPNTLN